MSKALCQYQREPLGHLSGGEQQMLLVARALIQNSDVLLAEPTEGLAPVGGSPLALFRHAPAAATSPDQDGAGASRTGR